MLIYDGDELLVALVEHLRRNQGHVWLIQEKPVGVFALENGEVWVEKSPITLKVLISSHLLLYVIRSVHQVIQHLFLDELWRIVFNFCNDLLDLILCRKAAPQNKLEFTEHEKL